MLVESSHKNDKSTENKHRAK